MPHSACFAQLGQGTHNPVFRLNWIPMQVMQTLDLRGDDAASAYVKVEVVNVTFAKLAGEIQSRVGPK